MEAFLIATTCVVGFCVEHLTRDDSLDPGKSKLVGSSTTLTRQQWFCFLCITHPRSPVSPEAELHPESQRWPTTRNSDPYSFLVECASLCCNEKKVQKPQLMETGTKQAKLDLRIPAPLPFRRGTRVCWPHNVHVARKVINKPSSFPPFLLPPLSECSMCGFFSL